jgi:hypothetical protein
MKASSQTAISATAKEVNALRESVAILSLALSCGPYTDFDVRRMMKWAFSKLPRNTGSREVDRALGRLLYEFGHLTQERDRIIKAESIHGYCHKEQGRMAKKCESLLAMIRDKSNH